PARGTSGFPTPPPVTRSWRACAASPKSCAAFPVKYRSSHTNGEGSSVQDREMERPRIVPMIAYENGAAAIDWLVRAFGFRELDRITESDGTISHAELDFEGGRIFLATPTPDYQGPKHHRERCAAAKRWSAAPWAIHALSAPVDPLDHHSAPPQAAGAR